MTESHHLAILLSSHYNYRIIFVSANHMSFNLPPQKGLIAHFTHELFEATGRQEHQVTRTTCELYARALDSFSGILGADASMRKLSFAFDDKPEAYIRGSAEVNGHKLILVVNARTKEISLKIMPRANQEKTSVTVTMHFHDDGIDKIAIKKRWFDDREKKMTAKASAVNNMRGRTEVFCSKHYAQYERAFTAPFNELNAAQYVSQLQATVKQELA